MNRGPRLFATIVLAWFATWVLISWLSVPGLDSYGDMVENYAWSQTLAWGTFKHPPLFAWMVRAWFEIFPTHVWAYYVLSYLNAAAGVIGIVFLARLCVRVDLPAPRRDLFLVTVLLFAVLGFPYSNLAAKFNADTVLLSLWPWTVYAFFAALHAVDTRSKWLFALMLGAMAAASMLGKYFSLLLLVSLAIISFADRQYRRWYRTPYPYGAAAVFLLLLAPHAMWEIRMGFPFRNYLESKIDPHVDPGRIVLFLLSGIYYLPLSWIAWLILRKRLASGEEQVVHWAVSQRTLVLLCVLPALITASFNLFARVHLTTHWAIPIWFALPVLLAVWLLPDLGEPFAWNRFARGLTLFWAALLAGGVIYTAALSATGNARYSLARQEMVKRIETRFAERFPGQQLAWAGGSWPESGALSFFAANHPRALPGFPDATPAVVNPYDAWHETHGVVLCFASGSYARQGTHNTECETETRGWLRSHNFPVDEETLIYRAEGWRYIRAEAKNVTVFWVPPARTGL